MAAIKEIRLKPGDILYRAGETNDFAYVIETGEVLLHCQHDGRRVEIERRGKSSIVGELSILTGQPRAVTVEALTHCRIFRIPAAQIVNRFAKLDPVLRACVETSISFAGAFKDQLANADAKVTLAPSTLRNADELIEFFQLETDLGHGLKNGELSLVFQPIVDMDTSQIIGVEALTRWHHSTLGPIPPDRFIAVAESAGSIEKVTGFAVAGTCATLARLRNCKDAPKQLFASVNISGRDIERPGFVDFLAHTIDMHDLQPGDIKLEITETAMIWDSDTASTNMALIRALGCGISVDDFGTGYSNLAYLKSLPLTALKIDRAFAGDAHNNNVSRGIVRMLVSLGNDLGVDIIAEGVETPDDVATLRGLGCRWAQGFYYCKPMAEAQLRAVFAGTNPHHNVA